MRRVLGTLVVAAFFLGAGAPGVHAQTRSGGKTALWTVVGAGAGFGLGLYLGLNAFDDATNSDRKVWTSAIVGAAAGGTLGYLIGRQQRQPSGAAPSAVPKLSEREIRSLAGRVRLAGVRSAEAPMLQSPDAYSTSGQF